MILSAIYRPINIIAFCFLDCFNQRKRIKSYYYIPYRIDAWSHDDGSWATMSGLNIPVCPDMSLSFKTTLSMGDNINAFNGLKNAKIISIDYMSNYTGNSNNYHEFDEPTIRALERYSVSANNVTITSLSTGKVITDENGSLKQNAAEFSVKININKLSTNQVQGLGYNGTNLFLGREGFSRAIHYFVPLKITIEYDGDYEPNPCTETVNGVSPTIYAYQHPGTCCDEYPETCCNDSEKINKIKDTRPEVLDFCCTNTTDKILPSWLNAEWTQKLQSYPLPTFKHPDNYFNEWTTKFYNSSEDAICPTCDNINAYYYNSSTNSASQCCLLNPTKYTSRCEAPEVCNTRRCSSNSYFNNNYQCCCDANPDDERCANQSWASSGLSCSDSPTRINASFGEGTVAEGSSSSGRIRENISFTSYYTLEEMKNNILKSGTGFDYPLSVRHQVIKSARTSYNYYRDGLGRNAAINMAKSEIDNYLNLTGSERSKITNTSSKFIFSTSGKQEQYVLNGAINELSSTTKRTYIGVCYEEYDGEDTYKECDEFLYDYETLYTFTYDLTLKQKYISKQDASIATSYGSESQKKQYLDGGTKFYTEVNENTGIYDFYVKLDDSATGVSGNLKNYERNGFACQYAVVNEIKRNDKFDYGTRENPTPCADNEKRKGQNFYFRPISLVNPFPDRSPGSNWAGTIKGSNSVTKVNEYIKKSSVGHSNGDSVYGNSNEESKYEITLTPDLISEIKKYNKKQEQDSGKGYLNWDTMKSVNRTSYNTPDLISSFWDDSEINWGNNIKKIPSTTYRTTKIGDF